MGLQVDGDLLAGCRDLVTGSLWSGQDPLVGRLGQGKLEKLEGVLAIDWQG